MRRVLLLLLLLPYFRLFHLNGELGLFEGRALEASIASLCLLQPTEKVGCACELRVVPYSHIEATRLCEVDHLQYRSPREHTEGYGLRSHLQLSLPTRLGMGLVGSWDAPAAQFPSKCVDGRRPAGAGVITTEGRELTPLLYVVTAVC